MSEINRTYIARIEEIRVKNYRALKDITEMISFFLYFVPFYR